MEEIRDANAKSMKPRIDDTDRAILECLRKDARMPCSEISRRLGNITARAVRNRLDRLISEGYIAIAAGAVPERLGFPISADIYVDVEPGRVEQVAERLQNLDEVIYVALTTGSTDISITAVAVNMGALQDFITDKLHSIPGVTRIKTFVLTKVLRMSRDWPFPKDLPMI
jgi:Lrp/AsnC family transcriptional regulator for asnA, asnC and gidA